MSVHEYNPYPIKARFNNTSDTTVDGYTYGIYMVCGRWSVSDANPMLYPTPMELVPKSWPVGYEHDEVILVRDYECSRWEPRCFAKASDGQVRAYYDGKTSMTCQSRETRAWKHHRKYDENLAWKFGEEQ